MAFRLNPAPLAPRARLELEIIGLKGADRPQASDLQRLAAAEATLATLGTDTAAPIRLDTYRAARAERLQSIQRDRNHLRQFGDRAFVVDIFGARLAQQRQELAAMRQQLRAGH
jgi:hypothetical protein